MIIFLKNKRKVKPNPSRTPYLNKVLALKNYLITKKEKLNK